MRIGVLIGWKCECMHRCAAGTSNGRAFAEAPTPTALASFAFMPCFHSEQPRPRCRLTGICLLNSPAPTQTQSTGSGGEPSSGSKGRPRVEPCCRITSSANIILILLHTHVQQLLDTFRAGEQHSARRASGHARHGGRLQEQQRQPGAHFTAAALPNLRGAGVAAVRSQSIKQSPTDTRYSS